MPTPTVFTETIPYAGGYLISEANHDRSRDTVLLPVGQKVVAGQVLGELTASPGEFQARDSAAGDGSEVASAISIYDRDNTLGTVPLEIVVHSRDIEANEKMVVLPASANTQADLDSAKVELAVNGIILREADEPQKVFPLN